MFGHLVYVGALIHVMGRAERPLSLKNKFIFKHVEIYVFS